MDIRPLGPEHRSALAQFLCAGFRQPWTTIIEEMIHDRLPDNLEGGAVNALGLWDDDLIGVVAWAVDPNHPEIWRSNVLAIQNGHRRRGHGLRLKRELLERAKRAGARSVVSTVHRDNAGMIKLNEELGAVISRYPDDWEHLVCVIPV